MRLPGLPGQLESGRKDGDGVQPGGASSQQLVLAFGPNPNPQYLVLAVIDQGGYGAPAAAPLVRNIFDYILANPEPNGQDADPEQPGFPGDAETNPPAGTPTTTTTTTSAEVGDDRRIRHDHVHHSGRWLNVA